MRLKRQVQLVLTAAVVFAAASGSALAQQPAPVPTDPSNPRNQQPIMPSLLDMGSGTDQGNIGPFVTLDDKQFARTMAERCMMQVKLNELAQGKSESASVKQFSRDMNDSCTKMSAILNRASLRLEIKLPRDLDVKRKGAIDRIAALSGPAFDQAYLHEVMRLQNKALTVTQREAANGGVTGLRNWAGMMIPALQEQLRMAKQNLAADSVVSKK